MFKSRIVARMAFSAEELTAGVKLQNSCPFRELRTMLVRLTPKSTRFGDDFVGTLAHWLLARAFAVAFWMLP